MAKTSLRGRSTMKYLTSGRRVTEEGLRRLEAVLGDAYRVPAGIDSRESIREYWREERRRALERRSGTFHTEKSSAAVELKTERLHVDDDFRLPGKSMTDIDPDFFKIVSGRPIKTRKRITEYVNDVRSCFLARLTAGFRRDDILSMDESHLRERRQLEETRNSFLACLKAFESFLAEDHETCARLLEAARKEKTAAGEKLRVVEALRKELGKAEAEVLAEEEKWRRCKLLQRFLYLAAPQDWRRLNDPRHEEEGTSSDPCLFDRYREIPGVTDPSVDGKIARFLEEVSLDPRPLLYFTEPGQIVKVLQDLELNNMRALLYASELDRPVETALAGVENTKASLERDEEGMRKEIEYIRETVEEAERKCLEKEENTREIAFGLFRNLIGSEEYLSVTAYVEDAYEYVVGIEDSRLNPVAMMEEIETEYEKVALALDNLPTDTVVKTTRNFYRELRDEFAEAIEAERKVHQMERLLKRLSKALGPAKGSLRRRKLMPRSQPPKERLAQPGQSGQLTKEELDQVFFFGRPTETAEIHRPLCG